MIVVLASLLMAGVQTSPQAPSGNEGAVARPVPRAAPTAPTPAPQATVPPAMRIRPQPPVSRREIMGEMPANLREPALCFSHMELLIEKVSARGSEVQTPIWLIQEYWQSRLPDPDSETAVDGEIFARIKTALELSAHNEPDDYLRQLQGCVTEAAAGGALD